MFIRKNGPVSVRFPGILLEKHEGLRFGSAVQRQVGRQIRLYPPCAAAWTEIQPVLRIQRRFHPRCGTSFLLIVMILSILIFSVVTWDNVLIRILLKLALLPVVCGISYELIKLAGRYTNVFTRIISAPGLWLQRLTTREPDDGEIEVAITALERVIPDDPTLDIY